VALKLLSGMLVQRTRFTAARQYWSRGWQTLELNRFPGAWLREIPAE